MGMDIKIYNETDCGIGPGTILTDYIVKSTQIETDNALFNSIMAEFVGKLLCSVQNLPLPNGYTTVLFPGHHISASDQEYGPLKQTDVMVINSRLFQYNLSSPRNDSDNFCTTWKTKLSEHGIDFSDWYITSLSKSPSIDKSVKELRKFGYLLEQEILNIKPKYILAFGNEVLKYMFGNSVGVDNSVGKKLYYKNARVYGFTDVQKAFSSPVANKFLLDNLELFINDYKGLTTVNPLEKMDYVVIKDEASLKNLLEGLKGQTEFSIDCEWGGKDFLTGQLMTIQLAWSPTEAAVIQLRTAGGTGIFSPNITAALENLGEFFNNRDCIVYGHNLRADLCWLKHNGVDLTTALLNPESLDTMLAAHVLDENDSFGLESLSTRYLNVPRYDLEVAQYYKDNKTSEDEGYLNIPDDMLHKYGAADVIVTFLLAKYFKQKLNLPANSSLNKLFKEITMPVNLPILDIEMNGMYFDIERAKQLAKLFSTKRDELLNQVRTDINWPTFNFRSVDHMRELLFGICKKDSNGHKLSQCPQFGKTLNLTPIKSTAKYSKRWVPGEAPSTDAESLSILSKKSPIAKTLQELKFVDQICKNFLRDPEDGDGEGLIGLCHKDNRIRTNITQLIETGRYGSRNPNLQNIPNKQEKEMLAYDEFKQTYSGIFADNKDEYHTIRSCFTVPDNCVLVNCDYKQAEIFTLAYMSKDKALIAAVESGQDIHSINAIKMFNLTDEWNKYLTNNPTADAKNWLKATGRGHIRVATKAIVFGLVYGRQAPAIALEIQKEGIPCDINQAQTYITNFFDTFWGVKEFIDDTKKQIRSKRFVENAWGRRRRFYPTNLAKILAEQEREGVNFMIQGTVADTMSKALINLWAYPRVMNKPHLNFKIIMSIHDSVMFEIPIPIVKEMVTQVIPTCMGKWAALPKINKHLEIDTEITTRWGESPDKNVLISKGVPAELLI